MLRHFYHFLDNPPKPQKLKFPKQVYLKIDGTYFKHWGCALVYKYDQQVIFSSFTTRESYFQYSLDLAEITNLGYIIIGVVSDRHSSLISAIKNLFPDIPHQTCLVHLQRKCQSLLTRKPKTEAGKQLLELVEVLNTIKNHYLTNIWLKWLKRLLKRHENLIKQRTQGLNEETGQKTWWYTHKNLRRAFRSLELARDNLFLYLKHSGLPKDTNGLEAEFSHLKRKLSLHRGLKRERKANFVKWYFYFRADKKKG